MAPHSSTLAWKIPWTEEPGRLQTMGSWRVGHDWVTSLSLFPFMHWRRKWQPTPVFLPGESQGRGSLVGCHLVGCDGVAQSRTRLKRLSSSSSSRHFVAKTGNMVIFFSIGLVFTWANTTEIWGSLKKKNQRLSWIDNNSRRKTWGITVFSVQVITPVKLLSQKQAMPRQPMEFWLFVGGPRNTGGSFFP